MDPLIALEWHREYLEWLDTDTGLAYFTAFQAAAIKDALGRPARTYEIPELDARADREGTKLRQIMHATFLLAETYAVEQDMMELVQYAADSLPDDKVHAWTLPSPQGFALLPHSLTFMHDQQQSPVHVRGIAWYAVHNGVHIFFMSDNTDIIDAMEAYRPGSAKKITRLNMSHISFAASEFVPFDTALSDIGFVTAIGLNPASPNAADTTRRMLRLSLAFWHLCQQTIASNEPVSVPRHAAKRWKHAGGIDNHVTRIVRLRRRSGPAPDGEGREWHHRWIVRGHWRQQPCGPNRAQTRPVWIGAYIKGPEDAPLLDSTKVHHLVR